MDPLTVEGHENEFDCDNEIICPIQRANSEVLEFVFENSITDIENELLPCSSAGPSKRKILSPIQTSTLKEEKSTEKTNWKDFNINDLKRPLNPALLHPGMRDRNDMQDIESEDEQGIEPAVGSQIEDQELQNRRNGGGRGGTRGRGTRRRGTDRRRPTASLVRTLASNALAEKYEILADKKNIIADYTIKKMDRERLQAEEEHRLRKECLQLDVEIKKKQLEKLSR